MRVLGIFASIGALAITASLASSSGIARAHNATSTAAAQDSGPNSSQPAAIKPVSDVKNPPAPAPTPAGELTPDSRLLLVRDVDGEFAKAIIPLPGTKKGFRVSPGQPIDPQTLRDALRLWGTAANQGDTVQITGLDFHSHEVVVQINGGTKHHFRLRDHLQMGMSGGMGVASTDPNLAPQPKLGGVLVLVYKQGVPDLTPDDLKRDLSTMLDFSKQHSAAVNWVDTLPKAFQDAIKDHRAVEGMDHEMVLAAMGRPDKKVRERDDSGRETEDWIYGTPPTRTMFVTFSGDKVIRVEQFD
jgi:hypothetical protein